MESDYIYLEWVEFPLLFHLFRILERGQIILKAGFIQFKINGDCSPTIITFLVALINLNVNIPISKLSNFRNPVCIWYQLHSALLLSCVHVETLNRGSHVTGQKRDVYFFVFANPTSVSWFTESKNFFVRNDLVRRLCSRNG